LINSYSISGTTVSAAGGAVNLLAYLGEHVLKVVGKNANKYNSVDVKEFTITYTNPCPNSLINPGTINPMLVTVYGAKEE